MLVFGIVDAQENDEVGYEQGAEYEAGDTEVAESYDDAKDGYDRMDIGHFPGEHKTYNIIHSSQYEGTPGDDKKELPGMSEGHQIKCDGRPDDGGAYNGYDGGEASEYAPEGGLWNACDGIGCVTAKALCECYGGDTNGVGEGLCNQFTAEHFDLFAGKREVEYDGGFHTVGFHEHEVEEEVHHDDAGDEGEAFIEDGGDCGGGDGLDLGNVFVGKELKVVFGLKLAVELL